MSHSNTFATGNKQVARGRATRKRFRARHIPSLAGRPADVTCAEVEGWTAGDPPAKPRRGTGRRRSCRQSSRRTSSRDGPPTILLPNLVEGLAARRLPGFSRPKIKHLFEPGDDDSTKVEGRATGDPPACRPRGRRSPIEERDAAAGGMTNSTKRYKRQIFEPHRTSVAWTSVAHMSTARTPTTQTSH